MLPRRASEAHCGYAARVRFFVILALAAGCGAKPAPTREWCQSYVNELRQRGTYAIRAMTLNEANRELLGMVGSDPAIRVALQVCSDGNGDSARVAETRALRTIDLQHQITATVLSRSGQLDDARAKKLGELVDQLATAYTEPAPRRP